MSLGLLSLKNVQLAVKQHHQQLEHELRDLYGIRKEFTDKKGDLHVLLRQVVLYRQMVIRGDHRLLRHSQHPQRLESNLKKMSIFSPFLTHIEVLCRHPYDFGRLAALAELDYNSAAEISSFVVFSLYNDFRYPGDRISLIRFFEGLATVLGDGNDWIHEPIAHLFLSTLFRQNSNLIFVDTVILPVVRRCICRFQSRMQRRHEGSGLSMILTSSDDVSQPWHTCQEFEQIVNDCCNDLLNVVFHSAEGIIGLPEIVVEMISIVYRRTALGKPRGDHIRRKSVLTILIEWLSKLLSSGDIFDRSYDFLTDTTDETGEFLSVVATTLHSTFFVKLKQDELPGELTSLFNSVRNRPECADVSRSSCLRCVINSDVVSILMTLFKQPIASWRFQESCPCRICISKGLVLNPPSQMRTDQLNMSDEGESWILEFETKNIGSLIDPSIREFRSQRLAMIGCLVRLPVLEADVVEHSATLSHPSLDQSDLSLIKTLESIPNRDAVEKFIIEGDLPYLEFRGQEICRKRQELIEALSSVESAARELRNYVDSIENRILRRVVEEMFYQLKTRRIKKNWILPKSVEAKERDHHQYLVNEVVRNSEELVRLSRVIKDKDLVFFDFDLSASMNGLKSGSKGGIVDGIRRQCVALREAVTVWVTEEIPPPDEKARNSLINVTFAVIFERFYDLLIPQPSSAKDDALCQMVMDRISEKGEQRFGNCFGTDKGEICKTIDFGSAVGALQRFCLRRNPMDKLEFYDAVNSNLRIAFVEPGADELTAAVHYCLEREPFPSLWSSVVFVWLFGSLRSDLDDLYSVPGLFSLSIILDHLVAQVGK